MPSVAGAAFVKESYFDMGLVVSHEGVIIDKSEIIHASSEFGKTVKMNFLEYLLPKGKPRFDGVIFFSFPELLVSDISLAPRSPTSYEVYTPVGSPHSRKLPPGVTHRQPTLQLLPLHQ